MEIELPILDTSDPYMNVQYTGTLITSGTQYGEWGIYDVKGLGESLFIDGELQSCRKDEYIYHEMFVHSLMIGCKSPKKVLILGGGEGCVAREVFRWPSVQKVVQVDWNEQLVNYFKTDGAHWNGGVFSDSRMEYHAMDALKYLEECTTEFDAIFVDFCDPEEGEESFYAYILELARGRLSAKGGLILNGGRVGSPAGLWLADFCKTLFPDTSYERSALRVFVPSFLGEWCFLLAGPKNWSIYSNSLLPPEGCRRFRRRELTNTMIWSDDSPLQLRSFWQDTSVKAVAAVTAIQTAKKLTDDGLVEPVEFDLEHYGC